MPIHAYIDAQNVKLGAHGQFGEKEIFMKINDSFKSTVSVGIDKASAGKAESSKKSADTSVDSKVVENVRLSPMAAQLQSLEATLGTDNVFDSEKVAAIKSAIADGQFKVSSEKVADGLIESVKDLLNTKKT
jgi:negative regulator of flagellin synthesis FlgM